VDDDREPNNYVYVTKNCQTKPMPVDRNIANLKVSFSIIFDSEHIVGSSRKMKNFKNNIAQAHHFQ
jgi:hypothetical protein